LKLNQKKDFTFAKNVEEIEEQYEKHSNTAQLFFEKRVIFDPNSEIKKDELWEEYKRFCESKGIVEVSDKKFWQTFRITFPNVEIRQLQREGVIKRYLIGVRLVEEEEDSNKNLENNNEDIIKQYFISNNPQDSQDKQDFPYNKLFEKISLYLDNIYGKSRLSCENCEPSKNIQTNVNISIPGIDPLKLQTILHLITTNRFSNVIDPNIINQT
ncbi:MAG: hypothetical protein ACP5HJ_04005, partial [Candidatus Micrarchaeia archaeon]